MVDVCNYSLEYSLCGFRNHMSPDDHYADLKRVIAAAGGKARRITVIMPFLYESRQHKRNGRESLDCALMLQELTDMGVDNIIHLMHMTHEYRMLFLSRDLSLYQQLISLSNTFFLMWTTFILTVTI